MINETSFCLSRICSVNNRRVIDIVFQVYFVTSILKLSVNPWNLLLSHQINDKLFFLSLKSETNDISSFVYLWTWMNSPWSILYRRAGRRAGIYNWIFIMNVNISIFGSELWRDTNMKCCGAINFYRPFEISCWFRRHSISGSSKSSVLQRFKNTIRHRSIICRCLTTS